MLLRAPRQIIRYPDMTFLVSRQLAKGYTRHCSPMGSIINAYAHNQRRNTRECGGAQALEILML
jgi:hypothetical protein